jgi:hypothetical protein
MSSSAGYRPWRPGNTAWCRPGRTRLAAGVDDGRVDAGQRDAAAARLDRQKAQAEGVTDDGAAGLCLPHVVDHGARAAEHLVV